MQKAGALVFYAKIAKTEVFMSYLLYKKLRESKSTHSSESPTPRWFIACVAGVVAGVASLATHSTMEQSKEREAHQAKITAPGTIHVSTICTVNAVTASRRAKVLKLVVDNYITASGEQLKQVSSTELQHFSWVSGNESVNRLPFWSRETGCAVGPNLD